MTTTGWIVAILSFAVALVLGFAACTLIRRRKEKNDQRKIEDAEQEALRIVNEAIKSSENKKREALLEAKEEILKSRSEYEKEVKERRADLQKQERRLQQKEENLDHKMDAIEKKEEALAAKHAAADKENEEIQIIKRSQTEMLERISGFTADQAKDYLIAQVESEVTHETALKIKEIEARAKDEADSRAREIVATAIQRCAAAQHKTGHHDTQQTVADHPVKIVVLARADILAGKGNSGLCKGVHGGVHKALQIGGSRVARHHHGAEGVDGRLDDHIGKAEHRALQPGRQADEQNVFGGDSGCPPLSDDGAFCPR